MTTPKTLTCYVLLESIAPSLLRGTTLPPLKLDVISSSWQGIEKTMFRQLRKQLPKLNPIGWSRFRSISPPVVSTVQVTLAPTKKNALAAEEVQLELDTFRWTLDAETCDLQIPALGINLVGKSSEIDEARIIEQARGAILRLIPDLNLQGIVDRFSNRRFSLRSFSITIDELMQWSQATKPEASRPKTPTLKQVGTNIQQWNREATFSRETEVSRLSMALTGEHPQSILLVGPSGVGKTAIVRELVHGVATGIPFSKEVWSTSGARLVSGMYGYGMWQLRCQKVLKEIRQIGGVLHLGSLFELMESGRIDGQNGVASMLRSSIQQGRLTAIAECTPEQIAIIERSDPMLLRSFTKVEIDPPSAKQLEQILDQVMQRLVHQRNQELGLIGLPASIRFETSATKETIELHRRFATYSAMPAQPIRFLQTLVDDLQPSAVVTRESISRQFASQTGLPVFLLDDSVPLNVAQIEEELSSHVIGQNEPIVLIANVIATLKARLSRPDRPLASFLFIGPTGVGKTETAKALAKILYNDAQRMIRLDMSEYANPSSATRLLGGASMGYGESSCDGNGTLTSPIRDQPFSVVLLDEFEKADPAVLDLLLQVLGEGRLTDSAGRLADFRNAVIIFTSNLGADSFRSSSFGFGEEETNSWRSHFEKEVQRYLRPEMLGRLDRIVPFRPLEKEAVARIAVRELEAFKRRPGVRYGRTNLEFDASVIEWLAEHGYEPKYGARPLRRLIEREIVEMFTFTRFARSPHVTNDEKFVIRDNRMGSHVTNVVTDEKSGGQKRREQLLELQELRNRAELLIASNEFKRIQNTLDRLHLSQTALAKKIKQTTSITRRKHHQGEYDILLREISTLEKQKESWLSVVELIQELHRTVFSHWFESHLSIPDTLPTLIRDYSKQLGEIVIALHTLTTSEQQVVSLFLTGPDVSNFAFLWRTYQNLARVQNWKGQAFIMKPYDSKLDSESSDYLGKEAAEEFMRKQGPNYAKGPSLRMLGDSSDDTVSKCKTIDLYRLDDFAALQSIGKDIKGIAIQFRGAGAYWNLCDEEGVHHAITPGSNDSTTRMRCRVFSIPSLLASAEIRNDWQEMPALPVRDPIRIYDRRLDRITNEVTHESIRIVDNMVELALSELMAKERASQVWRLINFEPIPHRAQCTEPLFDPLRASPAVVIRN